MSEESPSLFLILKYFSFERSIILYTLNDYSETLNFRTR